MAQPYVGEIRMFGGNFAPAGWMFCEGQLLPISENETLFQLIGTTYGGDGESTFALPDLRGRLPIHQGTGLESPVTHLLRVAGAERGDPNTYQQIPVHSHGFWLPQASGNATSPANNVTAQSSQIHLFTEDVANKQMNALDQPCGRQSAAYKFQPYLCVNFIISLFGIFPHQ